MKKALSLILALVMCLSLIPMTALAYGNEWIQLEKSNYDPGEKMVVTIKGVTQQMVTDSASTGWVQVTNRNNYCSRDRLKQVGETVFVDFEAPVEPGDYEFCLYRAWDDTKENLVTAVPFTVGKVAKDGNISLDKSAYTAMERITVSYSGITQNMVNSNAQVLMYPKGAAHGDNSLTGESVKLGSGTITTFAPNQNGEFEIRLYTVRGEYNDDTFVMSVPFTVSGATGSDWARGELEKANALGLIPDMLKGQDLAKHITRREFAAVGVKLYENLTGTKATPAAVNPFKDTNDAEVLKAYNVGITSGTLADEFSPDVLLSREQAATMLTRVLKAAYIDGWTLATDGDFTLNFAQPAKFADDDRIGDYAKQSVYFMVANGIINGLGDNKFGPKNTTPSEEALNYAGATREQSLAIAVRIVENLKDKPLDFQ